VGQGGRPADPLPRGVTLLHEDPDLLVAVKPAGLLTIATASEREETLYAFLTARAKRADPRARVLIVHRLDREASGLLVFARTPEAKQALQAQFRAHSVERAYLAVVEGTVAADADIIDLPLREDPASGRVRAVPPGAGGKRAVTRFRVLGRREAFTTLAVRLETGRKHQIRVHLAAIGHPVAGDPTYGAPRPGPLGRLALHAATLAFDHPRTGERRRFESPPPPAFRRVGG
jgi:23S rRNA pseudouridine1911/1915/1917 synthase